MAKAEGEHEKGAPATAGAETYSKWRSPLVVAVLAAGAAGLSNAGVTYLNGQNERALEASKAETTLILEMIKTGGNPDRAADNLRFLVDAGLISEPDRVAQIRRYLVTRAPGTGVTLPTGTDRFRIQGSEALGESGSANLKSHLAAYAQYLNSLGFTETAKQISVKIDEEIGINAFYSPDEKSLTISPQIVNDKHVPLYTYTQHTLDKGDKDLNESYGYLQINTALADYFASSYLDNPLVGQEIAKLLTPGNAALRNLDNQATFAQIRTCEVSEPLKAGEIWGGAFWEIRSKLGKATADRLLSAAWRSTPPTEGQRGFAQAFVDNLRHNAAEALIPEEANAVVKVLRARQFLDVAVLKSNPCA